MVDDQVDAPTIHDEIQALLSDYLEGTLAGDGPARVRDHLALCVGCKATHDELREMRSALSGMRRQPAPDEFRQQVTETIHRRSAGRFFARRTFGDRVPFGVLLVIALIVLIGVAALLWSSTTGSIHYERPRPAAPEPPAPIAPPPP